MARWTILLLVLVAAGISLAEVPAMKTEVASFDLTCPANGIGGRFPVPGFCEFFFECQNGNPILFQCNEGLLYDKDRRECRDRRYVKCDAEDYQKPDVGVQGFNFKCPHSWGAYPNPYDCSQFFVCNDYRPILYQCYKNFLFDDKIRRCLPTQKVNCGIRPNKERVAFWCPSPNGRFPDPKDCSRYYECRANIYHPFQCPKGQLYDVNKLHCMPEKTVNCGNRPGGSSGGMQRFVCPSPNGRFPSPHDCSQYYECKNNFVYIYTCPKFYLFDEAIKHCNREEYVNCGQRPGGSKSGNRFICPSPNGRFPDPLDCSRFYDCKNSVVYPYQCPKTQLYDEFKKVCNLQRHVNCKKRPMVDAGNKFYCPHPNGRFADPQNCSRYFECQNSIAYYYQCVKNQLYDEKKQHCLDKKEVDCGKRPKDPQQKPGTVTPTTTTTTAAPTTSTPVPTSTTPATTTTTPIPTTPIPTTTTKRPRPTIPPTKNPLKPNTPPPTDCHEDDLDCIIDATGDIRGWFDCPRRFGHYAHGSSKRLFIHCDNWRPFVKECAEETEFSPLYHVCVWVDKTKGI